MVMRWNSLSLALLAALLFSSSSPAQTGHDHSPAKAPAVSVALETSPSPPQAGSEAGVKVTLTALDGGVPVGLEKGHERLEHFLS